jgi:hypothetical protein
MSSADVRSLRESLEGLHEARARLDDILTSNTAPELLELNAAVLSTVKRLLGEMDLDERVRGQVRMLRQARARRPHHRGPAPADEQAAEEPTPDTETQVLPPQRHWRGRRRT